MFESKRRAFAFMLGAILFGLLTVILFSDYMSETKASLGEYATVHVAKRDIAAGMPLADDMVAEEQIPRKFMLNSLIGSKEELRGKISMVPIPAGAVITSSMLRDNTIVTEDSRQVMLRAPLAVFDDQIDTFDTVDLFVSYDGGPDIPPTEDKRKTELLLQDLTVNRVDKRGEELIAIGVVVKLEQSQKVIWALNYGKEVRVLKSGSAKVAQKREDAAGGEDNGNSPASRQGMGDGSGDSNAQPSNEMPEQQGQQELSGQQPGDDGQTAPQGEPDPVQQTEPQPSSQLPAQPAVQNVNP